MTKAIGNETYHFTYHIAHHEGNGSVDFMSRPTDSSPTQYGWKTALLQKICQRIAELETTYVVEAVPNSEKTDRASEPDHIAFLHIVIDEVPELTYNPDHYVVKSRK